MIRWVIRLLHRLEKRDKSYLIESDKFLQEFDRKYPQHSGSQLHEIEKHRDIFNRKAESRIRW